jgi:hypothetical protein
MEGIKNLMILVMFYNKKGQLMLPFFIAFFAYIHFLASGIFLFRPVA